MKRLDWKKLAKFARPALIGVLACLGGSGRVRAGVGTVHVEVAAVGIA